ncbi:plasmid partitioning protein RepB [Methylobacterium platani]|uniref:Plasmid partitioning protein RepB n=2 Tax=Methylobacterium platani TaxID=427683 RepID=A0A179SDS9_9HYPH|nr:plasmid partitioning protein RepB [Methylobacterium platani]KMO17290.1 plasmid partitioning protein [Methylobacterium platani JCM 14648]OAS25594.1 plasmid partitioning protein RepB [Methylobacterium platani]
MSRKSNLDALFGARPAPQPAAPPPEPEAFAAANPEPAEPEFAAANPRAPERSRSGPVRAMSSTLRGLAARADAAAEIEAGTVVVEIAPERIDDSFIADRVADETDPGLPALVESIRESGQQVPILVRPHPDDPERYQVAYGRRRIQAARRLARPVRAVVRPLSDAELVVAQGKENLERQDLSYIERAFFALRLEEHGFARATITAAMGVGKGDLSTLISVARTVPPEIVRAIGPAPAAGRPRWMLLAERIRAARSGRVAALVADPGFREKPTNERFAALLDALAPLSPARPAPQVWSDEAGRGIARIERKPDRVAVTFDDRAEPGLADYVLDRLPEILAAYRAGRSRP